MINKQNKLNFADTDYELLLKKYDKKANNEIDYELLISDMQSPYKCIYIYSFNIYTFLLRDISIFILILILYS